jgi:hypothetical protein
MSQWGRLITAKGGTFVPLVNSPPFAPIRGESLIVDVIMVDKAEDAETLKELRSFIGAAYSRWPAS